MFIRKMCIPYQKTIKLLYKFSKQKNILKKFSSTDGFEPVSFSWEAAVQTITPQDTVVGQAKCLLISMNSAW